MFNDFRVNHLEVLGDFWFLLELVVVAKGGIILT